MQTPIRGWFGQRDQFGMERDYAPAEGIRRFAAGTPPILGLPLVEIGAKLVAEAGIDRLAAKSARSDEHDHRARGRMAHPVGFSGRDAPRPGRPRCTRESGPCTPHGRSVAALIEAAKVIPDFRAGAGAEPGGRIRLGPAPLYTRHVDVWDAMARLRDLVSAGEHEKFSSEPGRVT